jgi:hypothetical protein
LSNDPSPLDQGSDFVWKKNSDKTKILQFQSNFEPDSIHKLGTKWFSKKIKLNYKYECMITKLNFGIET